MRLLVDTHALIWYVDQDHLLSPTAHAAISDPSNELLLSAGTVWEISIKVGLRKLALSRPYRPWIEKAMAELGLAVLPHRHRDPIDRLLAAQAQVEQVPLVSSDPKFDPYGIARLR